MTLLLRQVSVELHVGLAGWSSENVDVIVAVVAVVFVVLTAKAMGNVAVEVRNDRGRATTLRH